MLNDLYILDMEVQEDFFLPGGSYYTPQADKARGNVVRLFRWVRQRGLPVISTVLRVRHGELGPMGQRPHCIEGTPGERKLPETILSSRIDLGVSNSTDLPPDIFERHQQVIVEKRMTDVFLHGRLERMITELGSCTFVLLGAGLADGICQSAIGLRSRGFGVILATDATLDLGSAQADMARRRMDAKGVVLATVDEIIAPRKVKGKLRPFRTTVQSKIPA